MPLHEFQFCWCLRLIEVYVVNMFSCSGKTGVYELENLGGAQVIF